MRILLSLLISFIAFPIFGKSNKIDPECTPIDRARYKVVYTLNFIEDTINRKIKNATTMLLIGDSISIYGDKCLLDSDSVGYDFRRLNNGERPGPMEILPFISNIKFTYSIYKGYPEKNTITKHDNLVGIKCYKEPTPQQDWTETGRTKDILGLNCKEAVCSYRGRDYVAYYCPDIPLSYGPDVFGGLPGLIMELQDGKQEYIWNIAEFETCDYDTDHTITINLKDSEWISRDKYRDVELNFNNNPWLLNPNDESLKKFAKSKPYNPVEKY